MVDPNLNPPRFQGLFESLPGLYLALAPDAPRFTIIAATDGYLAVTMTAREDLIGRGMFEVFSDDPSAAGGEVLRELRRSLTRVIETRRPDAMPVQRYDLPRPAEEGGGFIQRYWSPVNSPVLAKDGTVEAILHRAADVTGVMMREQNLSASPSTSNTDAMAGELILRAEELQAANEQLRNANAEITRLYEKTKELDTLKTDFFAAVGHDLRTPLSLIIGPTERMLLSSELPLAARRDLSVVAHNAKTMLGYLNELLDVAKLEAKRMEPDFASTDLARMLSFVASHFELAARDQEISFFVDAPSPFLAEVDADKLSRAVFNLLANAFKHTPRGGRVRLSLEEGPANTARIAVADSGPGVPPEHRTQVFEKFRRFDSDTTSGSGLGLAIAFELVELHRGELHLDDAPEGGALFVIEVPRRVAGLSAVAPSESGEETAPLVLVAEDNVEMNRFVSETLSRDYRVVSVADGASALENARALEPDLILTDLIMPVLSGEELVRRVRETRELDTVPIVVLTAKIDEALRVELLRGGAQDFLGKPFSTAELRARVANLVSKKRAEDAVRQSRAELDGIVSISADAIISIDEEQRIIRFNEGAERIFGWSREEMLGRPLELLMPERFRGGHRQLVERFAAGPVKATLMGEGRPIIAGLDKHGREFPAEASISKLETADGRILTVALRDVSRRKRAEDQQRFLAEVGETLARSLDYDQTLERVAALAVKQLADASMLDLVEEERLPRRVQVNYRDPTRAQSSPLDPVQPLMAEALRTRSAQLTRAFIAVPLIANGRLLGTIGFAALDESIAYDAESVRFAEELARRFASAIENARLYRVASQAIRSRDEVLGVVAHDLRTPLGGIRMLAKRCSSSIDQERAKQYAAEIGRAGERMDRLIRDLLEVTRIEGGRLTMHVAPLSVESIADDVRTCCGADVEQAKMRLAIEVQPGLPQTLVDRDRLIQVFTNLIGNATKFANEGSQITVKIIGDRDMIRFSVADQGPGVSKQDLPHLFDRFWQAHRADRRGAGLGLAIVKGIIESLGGRIWVDSSPAGTTFSFVLPAQNPSESLPERNEAS